MEQQKFNREDNSVDVLDLLDWETPPENLRQKKREKPGSF